MVGQLMDADSGDDFLFVPPDAWQCDVCGTINDASDLYCINCRLERHDGPD